MNNQQNEKDTQSKASTANFCYVIETLEIELNRLKALLRLIDQKSYELMSNIPGQDELQKNKETIEVAIKLLSA